MSQTASVALLDSPGLKDALARIGEVSTLPQLAMRIIQVSNDPRYLESVEQRLQPAAKVAVAGQDNSALKIESVGPALPVAALPADGTAAYQTACAACHGAGIAGAPKVGDKAAWGPRIAQGKETLYNHALHGFNGKTGVMPAKGGRADWPDDLVKQAVSSS